MTFPSRRNHRTTAFRITLSRTAISLGLLIGVSTGAGAQAPAPKPDTTWTPYTKPAPTTAPHTIPVAPVASKPSTVPAVPISIQPGLVPQTLGYQKSAEPTVPAAGIPAIPVSSIRTPDPELPPINIEATKVGAQTEVATTEPMVKILTPKREDVFRLEGDAAMNARIQKELGDKKDPFPPIYAISLVSTPYAPKTGQYPPMQAKLEPTYVVHRRLYFEDKNTERGGWDLGALQPFASTASFVRHVVFLPHNYASGLWRNRWDTNAGKCMPGDKTPLYLYPPGFTVSGLMFQSSVLVGLPFIFP